MRMKVAVVTAHMEIENRKDDIKEKNQRNTSDTDLMNEDIHVGSIQGKGNPRGIKNEIGKVEEKKVNGDTELSAKMRRKISPPKTYRAILMVTQVLDMRVDVLR
jgi:hypothetical protein